MIIPTIRSDVITATTRRIFPPSGIRNADCVNDRAENVLMSCTTTSVANAIVEAWCQPVFVPHHVHPSFTSVRMNAATTHTPIKRPVVRK